MSTRGNVDKISQDWDVVVITKRPDRKLKARDIDMRKGGTQVMKRFDNTYASKMKKLEMSIDDEEGGGARDAPKISVELRLQIQKARVAKGLTQKQLAGAMSIPVSIIQGYEGGKVVPSGAFLAKLERHLGCKFDRPKKGHKG